MLLKCHSIVTKPIEWLNSKSFPTGKREQVGTEKSQRCPCTANGDLIPELGSPVLGGRDPVRVRGFLSCGILLWGAGGLWPWGILS